MTNQTTRPSETIEKIAAWADTTFGQIGTQHSRVSRALIEWAELNFELHHPVRVDPRAVCVECADVYITMGRFVNYAGISQEMLWDWVDEEYRFTPKDVNCPRLSWDVANHLIALQHQRLLRSCLPVVVARLARICEIQGGTLAAFVDTKMEVNRSRRWKVVDGHGQHV